MAQHVLIVLHLGSEEMQTGADAQRALTRIGDMLQASGDLATLVGKRRTMHDDDGIKVATISVVSEDFVIDRRG